MANTVKLTIKVHLLFLIYYYLVSNSTQNLLNTKRETFLEHNMNLIQDFCRFQNAILTHLPN